MACTVVQGPPSSVWNFPAHKALIIYPSAHSVSQTSRSWNLYLLQIHLLSHPRVSYQFHENDESFDLITSQATHPDIRNAFPVHNSALPTSPRPVALISLPPEASTSISLLALLPVSSSYKNALRSERYCPRMDSFRCLARPYSTYDADMALSFHPCEEVSSPSVVLPWSYVILAAHTIYSSFWTLTSNMNIQQT